MGYYELVVRNEEGEVLLVRHFQTEADFDAFVERQEKYRTEHPDRTEGREAT
jgi:hypothetical protein